MTDISPIPFVEATLAYQKTAAIKAAVDLDLFTFISEGIETIEELAARARASERGLRILCDYLVTHGFLEAAGERYTVTASSRMFLDRRSPAYMGSIVDFHAAPEMCALFLTDPVSYVRQGGAAGLGSVAPDHPLWLAFAEAMAQVMTPLAKTIAKRVADWPKPPRKVLEIAPGHGMFGISIAAVIPEMELVAVDWPGVLAIARRNAEKAGVDERFRERPGSAFEVDWGGGYDLIMLANFLHHFDFDTCVDLLRRVRGSLSPGGRALAVEFVPNEDRRSPAFQAGFAFYMLGSTPGGTAYTASEFERMATMAGFNRVELSPLPRSAQNLVQFEP